MITISRALGILLLAMPLLATGEDNPGYQQDTFAIAAEGTEVTSEISKLSGISPYFHIYDIDGKVVEILANPHLDLEFGIGPAAAATLADKGVTVLVGGKAGPKMKDVLDARGVRFVRRYGFVEDVVRELRSE